MGITHQKTIKFSQWYSHHLHILFFQSFLFTYDASTSLMQLATWNYWMEIMNQKIQSIHLIYLKERSEWIINHIHLHLFPMYQTNHQVPLITFHLSMKRFNIIWNLEFGQVHILDLPLLQTWNSYLNYS